eukprot:Protomagalhaensia_sp_Gyna_25__241@NODE_1112_length_2178_cov_89_732585_g881_i0_p1_GENE_NODE_1112_length_2178_cov_89_732585_g881_i0NODE_1112_length_2178_cov_89_732585_g881_i0_p1_ORF_typecomplete_len357_score34_89GRASP55_65/PF04495_14/2_4e12GRASP55_65/PF04495_14/9_2e15PDZ_2/PF13180_6/0_022PDZ_2/PF13180_6/0_1PDZ_6/PF17820_1/0_067PDZ_6/PF17820_1/83_NODE_1112_length_2178_cov_89_732585_g881_i010752145
MLRPADLGVKKGMGNEGSTPIDAGFRVLKVHPNSLAAELKLEPYYDFIVSIGDRPVTPHKRLGIQIIEAAATEDPELGIYNAAKRTARRVRIPRPEWGEPIQLGAVVRYLEYSKVYDKGLKVLKVFENTPAAKIGLVPQEDWLVATPEGPLCTSTELARALCKAYVEQVPLGLVVYSIKAGSTRELYFTPALGSTGNPILGAELGEGPDHRLPFPTPTVSITNSPAGSAEPSLEAEASVPASEKPRSRKGSESHEDELAPFSPSWLMEQDSTPHSSSLESLLRSLRDETSMCERLLRNELDPTRRYPMSVFVPLVFDSERITSRRLGIPIEQAPSSQCRVSIPYFTIRELPEPPSV